MKVILVEPVEDLGRAGDVKDVRPGHARNYLLPRGLVVPATPHQMRRLARLRAEARQAAEQEAAAARTLAQRLRQLTVVMPARVGEGGRLHGTVTSQQIATALAEQHQIRLDRRDVVLREPLRHLGSHQVMVRLPARETATLTIEVVPEVAEEPAAEAAATSPAAEPPAAEAAEAPGSEPVETAEAAPVAEAEQEPAVAEATSAETESEQ